MSEINYLNALREVVSEGTWRETRNAKTLSKFGIKMEFDISESFPLLTTKRMFWKGVLTELLWFIAVKTNAKELADQGVHIWDGNTTREFLDQRGLNEYEEGDCGPIYGFQWRHFNAKYKGHNENYDGEGVDQLQECIHLIKNDPSSRRIYMTAWNPQQLSEMCLPPCHVSYQFYVEDGYLSCMMYQRSGDMFLGIPFNIASTALLTNMIANVCGLKTKKIILVVGDAHIYENHMEAVEKQLEREPYSFPKLIIKNNHLTIDDFMVDDFEIVDYQYHPTIKAEMVA